MSVTYKLLEQYTGTRTNEYPDPDNEGEIITETVDCTDVQVRFTCNDTDCVHERSVNVCFNAEGAYDADATDIRIGQVANGVANKIACGVITASS